MDRPFTGFANTKGRLYIAFDPVQLPPRSAVERITNWEAGMMLGAVEQRLNGERLMNIMEFDVELGRIVLGQGTVNVVEDLHRAE